MFAQRPRGCSHIVSARGGKIHPSTRPPTRPPPTGKPPPTFPPGHGIIRFISLHVSGVCSGWSPRVVARMQTVRNTRMLRRGELVQFRGTLYQFGSWCVIESVMAENYQ